MEGKQKCNNGIKVLHREANCEVANTAIGFQSPMSHVNNWCFLCDGTKQLYKGRLHCTLDGSMEISVAKIANSALLYSWWGGDDTTSLCDDGRWEETTCYSQKNSYL